MSAVPGKVVVGFRAGGVGAGPLTQFKQRTWAPLGGVASLPAGTTVDELAGRLRGVMMRSESMRTRVRVADDGTAEPVVHADGWVDLHVVEAGDEDPGVAAESLCARWRADELDFSAEWPLKIAVVLRAGAPTHVAVLVSDLATDAEGALTVLAEVAGTRS